MARRHWKLLGSDTEVVLLDLGLPDLDGIDLCRLIRQRSGVPIIIATARSHVQERIRGLRAGATTSSSNPTTSVSWWRASKRSPGARERWSRNRLRSFSIDVAGVRIDLSARQVLIADQPVELTRTEFDIIAVLARYPGVVVPRERIIREVWQTDWHAFSRSLEVHIGSIRRKTGRGDLIETVRGVGYRLTGK